MITSLAALLLLTAALLVVLGVSGKFSIAPLLRRTACGLTLASTLALVPWTFEDAGAAAGVFLGVPVVLIMAVMITDMSQRDVRLVSVVAAVSLLIWSAILALSVGLAFAPPALLLLTSAGLETKRTSSRSNLNATVPARSPQP